MTIEIINAGDLRTAYMQTFNAFALVPSDIVESSEGRINSRYARELLGTLTHHGFLTEADGADGTCWQVVNPGTYDDHTEQEAAAVIDAWLSNFTTKEKNMSTTTATKPASTHPCYCKCGAQVPEKSFYKPGHDARHAGQVGRTIADNYNVKGFDRRDLLNDLPSEKLVAKAQDIAANIVDKIEAKEAKARAKEAEKASKPAKSEPEPEFVEGTVTVGKNERVARRVTKTGVVEFMDNKGEWKAASKAASATFEA